MPLSYELIPDNLMDLRRAVFTRKSILSVDGLRRYSEEKSMIEPWFEVEIAITELEADGVVRLEPADRNGRELPEFTAGAHFDVEVAPGLTRQYLLRNSPRERYRYVIGVLKEQASRGGSRTVHDSMQVGQTIRIRTPRNHFEVVPDASGYILFAGGIGVTLSLTGAKEPFRDRRIGATG